MLNDEIKAIWNANAEFWDRRMGEGNDFHKTLIEPTQLRLLGIKPGQRTLDIACGNGQFARKMASLGALVTATDFSEKMINIAKTKPCLNVQFSVADASKAEDMAKLEGTPFDGAVCTMALMDIESIDRLAASLPSLLIKQGVFVFSVLHPCFNSLDSVQVHERDEAGEVHNRYGIKVFDYLVERSGLGIAMVGQPEKQYYFHRPLSGLLRPFFSAGFCLDAAEEPSFADAKGDRLHEQVFRTVPAALVCRLRLR